MVLKKKSGLSAKTDKWGKSLKAHGGDETSVGRVDLPLGIKNGRARVVSCKIDKYKTGNNVGEEYFRAEAIVLSPKTVPNFGKVEGLRTSIMEALCDTTKGDGSVVSFDEHVANVLNELRKMGAETEEVESKEEFMALCAAVQEEEPIIKFSTSGKAPSKDDPDPRVWHNWNGLAAEEDEEEDDEVEDETEDEEEDEEDSSVDEDEDEDEDEEESDDEEGEDDNEEEATAPDKGDVFLYKPKGGRKAIECEVTAVFATKETVNLKNLTDGKTVYKSVPWDKLES